MVETLIPSKLKYNTPALQTVDLPRLVLSLAQNSQAELVSLLEEIKPNNIKKILELLRRAPLEDTFYQEVDKDQKAVKKFTDLLEENVELAAKSAEKKLEEDFSIYSENTRKIVEILLRLHLVRGEFSDLIDLAALFNQFAKENKIFSEVFSSLEATLKDILSELKAFEGSRPSNMLLKNDHVVDNFGVSYVSLNSSTFTQKKSVCTDGAFLYILLNNATSTLLKVGTGKRSTVKGKVYLKKQIQGCEGAKWVFTKGKLYLYEPSVDLETLKIVSPSTFEFKENLKIEIPEGSKNFVTSLTNKFAALAAENDKIHIVLTESDDKQNSGNQVKFSAWDYSKPKGIADYRGERDDYRFGFNERIRDEGEFVEEPSNRGMKTYLESKLDKQEEYSSGSEHFQEEQSGRGRGLNTRGLSTIFNTFRSRGSDKDSENSRGGFRGGLRGRFDQSPSRVADFREQEVEKPSQVSLAESRESFGRGGFRGDSRGGRGDSWGGFRGDSSRGRGDFRGDSWGSRGDFRGGRGDSSRGRGGFRGESSGLIRSNIEGLISAKLNERTFDLDERDARESNYRNRALRNYGEDLPEDELLYMAELQDELMAEELLNKQIEYDKAGGNQRKGLEKGLKPKMASISKRISDQMDDFTKTKIKMPESDSLRLILLTYNIEPSIAEETKKERDALVEELYDSFTGLYSREKVRKCLEANDFEIEATAEFMANFYADDLGGSSEVLKPSKTVLFKCSENNVSQFVEINQFYRYQWIVVDGVLYGYSLREGCALVFSMGEPRKIDIKVKDESNSAEIKAIEKLMRRKVRDSSKEGNEKFLDQIAEMKAALEKRKEGTIKEVKVETTLQRVEYDILCSGKVRDVALCLDKESGLFYQIFEDFTKYLTQNIVVHESANKDKAMLSKRLDKLLEKELKTSTAEEFSVSLRNCLLRLQCCNLPLSYNQISLVLDKMQVSSSVPREYWLNKAEYSKITDLSLKSVSEDFLKASKIKVKAANEDVFNRLTGLVEAENYLKNNKKGTELVLTENNRQVNLTSDVKAKEGETVSLSNCKRHMFGLKATKKSFSRANELVYQVIEGENQEIELVLVEIELLLNEIRLSSLNSSEIDEFGESLVKLHHFLEKRGEIELKSYFKQIIQSNLPFISSKMETKLFFFKEYAFAEDNSAFLRSILSGECKFKNRASEKKTFTYAKQGENQIIKAKSENSKTSLFMNVYVELAINWLKIKFESKNANRANKHYVQLFEELDDLLSTSISESKNKDLTLFYLDSCLTVAKTVAIVTSQEAFKEFEGRIERICTAASQNVPKIELTKRLYLVKIIKFKQNITAKTATEEVLADIQNLKDRLSSKNYVNSFEMDNHVEAVLDQNETQEVSSPGAKSLFVVSELEGDSFGSEGVSFNVARSHDRGSQNFLNNFVRSCYFPLNKVARLSVIEGDSVEISTSANLVKSKMSTFSNKEDQKEGKTKAKLIVRVFPYSEVNSNQENLIYTDLVDFYSYFLSFHFLIANSADYAHFNSTLKKIVKTGFTHRISKTSSSFNILENREYALYSSDATKDLVLEENIDNLIPITLKSLKMQSSFKDNYAKVVYTTALLKEVLKKQGIENPESHVKKIHDQLMMNYSGAKETLVHLEELFSLLSSAYNETLARAKAKITEMYANKTNLNKKVKALLNKLEEIPLNDLLHTNNSENLPKFEQICKDTIQKYKGTLEELAGNDVLLASVCKVNNVEFKPENKGKVINAITESMMVKVSSYFKKNNFKGDKPCFNPIECLYTPVISSMEGLIALNKADLTAEEIFKHPWNSVNFEDIQLKTVELKELLKKLNKGFLAIREANLSSDFICSVFQKNKVNFLRELVGNALPAEECSIVSKNILNSLENQAKSVFEANNSIVSLFILQSLSEVKFESLVPVLLATVKQFLGVETKFPSVTKALLKNTFALIESNLESASETEVQSILDLGCTLFSQGEQSVRLLSKIIEKRPKIDLTQLSSTLLAELEHPNSLSKLRRASALLKKVLEKTADKTVLEKLVKLLGKTLSIPKETREKSGTYSVVLNFNNSELDYQFILVAVCEFYGGIDKVPALNKVVDLFKKPHDKFNPVSNETKRRKMDFFYSIIQEKVDEVNKKLGTASWGQEEEEKKKLSEQLKYYNHASGVISGVESSCEQASYQGFGVLSYGLSCEDAERLAKLVYKAQNRQLELIKDKYTGEPFFNEEILYPGENTVNDYISGFSSLTKEITRNYVTPSLVETKVCMSILTKMPPPVVSYKSRTFGRGSYGMIADRLDAYSENRLMSSNITDEFPKNDMLTLELKNILESVELEDMLTEVDEETKIGLLALLVGLPEHLRAGQNVLTESGNKMKIVFGEEFKSAEEVVVLNEQNQIEVLPTNGLKVQNSKLISRKLFEYCLTNIQKTEEKLLKFLMLKGINNFASENALSSSDLKGIKAILRETSKNASTESELSFLLSGLKTKLTKPKEVVYFPKDTSETKQEPISPTKTDFSTSTVLPASKYISGVGSLADTSKSKCTLLNILSYEKNVLDILYTQSQSEQMLQTQYPYLHNQMRYLINEGNLTAVKDDISRLIGGQFMSNDMHTNQFKEKLRPGELSEEEKMTGYFYRADLSKVDLSRIELLDELVRMNVYSVVVKLILKDLMTGSSLVAFFDSANSKTVYFWIKTDCLFALNTEAHVEYSSLSEEDLRNELDSLFERCSDNLMLELKLSVLTAELDQGTCSEEPFSVLDTIVDNKYTVLDGVVKKWTPFIKQQSNSNSPNKSFKALEGEKMLKKWLITGVSNKEIQEKELETALLEGLEQLPEGFRSFKVDLAEQVENSTVTANSSRLLREEKIVSLTDLCDIKSEDYSGIVISFEKGSKLGIQGKMFFFNDKYGRNELDRVVASKTAREDLNCLTFSTTEVFFAYKKAIKNYFLNEWDTPAYKSNLKAIISFVPKKWNSIIWLADFLSSSALTEGNTAFLADLQSKLLKVSQSDAVPFEATRQLLKLTNRVLLKQEKTVSLDKLPIEAKFKHLGVSEEGFKRLVKKISNYVEKQESSFVSSVAAEMIEIVSSLLNILNLKLVEVEEHLKETLPAWVASLWRMNKAIKDLGKGTIGSLMSLKKPSVPVEFKNKLLVFKTTNFDSETMKNILISSGTKIFSQKCDIHYEKGTLVILTQGVNLTNEDLVQEVEETNQDAMWNCTSCGNAVSEEENSCIWCDAPKTSEKKEKKVKIVKLDPSEVIQKKKEELIKGVCDSFEGKLVDLEEEAIDRFIVFRAEKMLENCPQFKERAGKLGFTAGEGCVEMFKKLQSQGYDENLVSGEFKWSELNFEVLEGVKAVVESLFVTSGLSIWNLEPSTLLISEMSDSVNIPNTASVKLINSKLENVDYSVCQGVFSFLLEFNLQVKECLALLKPPAGDNSSFNETQNSIRLSETGTEFLSKHRGLIFFETKRQLLQEILSLTEIQAAEIETPLVKVTRIVLNSGRKRESYMFRESSRIISQAEKSETVFLQCFNQLKNMDPAVFRAGFNSTDNAHVAFKVKLENEFADGIEGLYRQIFSDIGSELRGDSDKKLNLFIPTSNNQAKQGEFAYKMTLNHKLRSREQLKQFKFLGILMGICLRTGVFLQFDLCSLVWKQIVKL